jgi:hypothetical protein
MSSDSCCFAVSNTIGDNDRLEPDIASQFFPFSFCPLNHSRISLATVCIL